MRHLETMTAFVFVTGLSAALGGCVVEPVRVRTVTPAPAQVVVERRPGPVIVEEDYTPMYYEGRPVYYDDAGTPIIYVGTEYRYVPRTYVHFNVLTGHYHSHRTGYHHWVRRHPHPPPIHRHHRHWR